MEKNCIIRNQLRRTPVSLFAARILDYLSPEMLFCPTIADQSGLIFFGSKLAGSPKTPFRPQNFRF